MLVATLAATRGATAAILYQGATVITFDSSTESLQVLRDASILIENDTISALNEGGPPTNLPANTTVVNATDKIIGPGYVDTHHHMWQTAFKTIASNTTLGEYFQRYGEYGPAEQNFTPDDVYVGTLAGYLELLYSGTTSVLDFAHASWSDETIDAAVNATFEGGGRSFYAHAVHIIPNGFSWEAQIQKLQSLTEDPRFAQQDPSSLVNLGLSYDAFFDAPASNVSLLWNITKESNLSVITMHYLGGPIGYANSPTVLQSYGILNDTVPIVFGHMSWPTFKDVQLLRETNQYISTTPESELHFGHVHPYAHLIQDQASIGVDCHFTFSSSMVTQARLWLQSLRWPNFEYTLQQYEVPKNNPMSVNQIYTLITRAGGLALRRPDIGVIEVGAKADILVYRTDAPNMIGWSDPVAAIILHSELGDLEDVLVGGQYVKRNGQLLYPGYEDIRQRLMASAERIQSVWANIDWAPLDGDFPGNGAPFGVADIIDAERGNGTGY